MNKKERCMPDCSHFGTFFLRNADILFCLFEIIISQRCADETVIHKNQYNIYLPIFVTTIGH